mmetsp:Transcript_7941/g.9098  ORF Transcript_7941/g.9098 Transcript_7941/m.9098 type:complete len:106 (+) Transcript_7941:1043-1360(+)
MTIKLNKDKTKKVPKISIIETCMNLRLGSMYALRTPRVFAKSELNAMIAPDVYNHGADIHAISRIEIEIGSSRLKGKIEDAIIKEPRTNIIKKRGWEDRMTGLFL